MDVIPRYILATTIMPALMIVAMLNKDVQIPL